MARYLVTGAAGFIGSHVSDALLARGDEVVGVDDFNDFYDPRLKEENAAALLTKPGFSLVRGDLLDESVRAAAFEGAPVEAVVHLAASAGVRPSIERPAHYQRNNVEVTTALLEDLRRIGERDGRAPRMVMASSSSVYGALGARRPGAPFHEDDNVDHPVSPYAATKKCCELLGYTFHHLFGLDVTCLRFFTVYGPRQRPEMAIHKFAALMMAGEPVPMFGDGKSGRDYTFIDDIVAGVVASVDRPRGYRVYNLGNHDVVTLEELIAKLGAALGVEPRIEQLPEQPGDVPLTFADVTRAGEELGYRPRTSIDEGLRAFAAWFLPRWNGSRVS